MKDINKIYIKHEFRWGEELFGYPKSCFSLSCLPAEIRSCHSQNFAPVLSPALSTYSRKCWGFSPVGLEVETSPLLSGGPVALWLSYLALV